MPRPRQPLARKPEKDPTEDLIKNLPKLETAPDIEQVTNGTKSPQVFTVIQPIQTFDMDNHVTMIDSRVAQPTLAKVGDKVVFISPPVTTLLSWNNDEVGLYDSQGQLIGTIDRSNKITPPSFRTFWPLHLDTGLRSHARMLQDKIVRYATRAEITRYLHRCEPPSTCTQELKEYEWGHFASVLTNIKAKRLKESRREWSKHVSKSLGKLGNRTHTLHLPFRD